MAELTLPKHLRELQRKLKRGYEIVPGGAGHFHIRNGDGEELVRARNGDILALPGTPARGELNKRTLQDVERAGVLREKRPYSRRKESPEEKEQRLAAIRKMTSERGKNRQKVADELYERLEKPLRLVGGIEMLGLKADLAYIGAMLARENGATSMTPDLLTGSAVRVLDKHWVTPPYQAVWNELADRLEAAEDVREEYFTLLRRARGLPEEVVASGQKQLALPEPGHEEWPFTVQLIKLDECMIDHSYQRPVPWPFVRRIAATFDEVLVGTIDVSERRGRYAIMDGQLRFEAMRMVGKTTSYASVYAGLDAKAEARFFLKKNADRKAIHPYYIYKAKLTARDPATLAMTKMVEQHGYQVSMTSAQHERAHEGDISAIQALEEAYARSNERYPSCLEPALQTMRLTTLGLRQGQNAVLIRALGQFYEGYPDHDEEHLRSALQRRNPEWLLSRTRELVGAGRATTKGMVRVIITEYNRGLKRGDQLTPPS